MNNKPAVAETGESNVSRDVVYQIVTDRIVELLKAGTVPWHKPWSVRGGDMPRNLVSKKAYRGINVWLLQASGFSSPYWLSFKQVGELGGKVRKGEKSTLVVFWKRLLVDDKDNPGQKKTIPLLRYYRVFNLEQCEGIEAPKTEEKPELEFDPIVEAEKIVAEMPNAPVIVENESRAYYRPMTDTVNMPLRKTFDSEHNFYSTLFHELVHSTGHKSRLGRGVDAEDVSFGSKSYAKEELLAEMGASFLCATAGILHRTVDNSAAYIAGWLTRLENDPRLVVNAAAAAHRATDYILGVKHSNEG